MASQKHIPSVPPFKRTPLTNSSFQIFSQTSDLVVVLSLDHHVEYANPAARTFFKLPKDVVSGHSFEKYLSGEVLYKFQEAIKKVQRSLKQFRMEVDFRVDQNQVAMELTIVPRMESKTLRGFYVNFRDISHERQIQELVRESQKMEALQYFVSGTTKEIQYPLLAILKKIEGFEHKYTGRSFEYVSFKEFDQIMNFLKVIRKQIKSCYDTTAKLSNINKKRLKYENHHCSGNAVIREVVRLKENDFKNGDVKFRLRLSDKLPMIAIGEIELNEIISHLIDNAISAMPGGGHLLVSTSAAASSFGQEVSIDITDDGVGISPEDLPHIFEPFFTTKHRVAEGSVGLGLSIVYSLVKAGHAQIKVKSSLRKGTTVHLTFPAAFPEREHHPKVQK